MAGHALLLAPPSSSLMLMPPGAKVSSSCCQNPSLAPSPAPSPLGEQSTTSTIWAQYHDHPHPPGWCSHWSPVSGGCRGRSQQSAGPGRSSWSPPPSCGRSGAAAATARSYPRTCIIMLQYNTMVTMHCEMTHCLAHSTLAQVTR